MTDADGPTYIDATEEAHYHPEAGRMWNRWMLRCERRGITYDAVALAEAALANADARDPLNGYRNCILRRNGRECRSYAGRPCAADCDIPF